MTLHLQCIFQHRASQPSSRLVILDHLLSGRTESGFNALIHHMMGAYGKKSG
ncbi:unnamed protein product [Rhodiola kirilowii]